MGELTEQGEDEVLHTALDNRPAGGSMPREAGRRRKESMPGRPALWAEREAEMFEPAPVWGAYPKRFVSWAAGALQCRPAEVLHVCSGMLSPADVGAAVRIDLRAAARPTVRADGRCLPFRDGAFRGVMIDPPYSVEYARGLYGVEYPRPSHLLREAARVTDHGGRIGFLHFLVPSAVGSGLTLERVYGITQGCGYRIRAYTIYYKPPRGMFDAPHG